METLFSDKKVGTKQPRPNIFSIFAFGVLTTYYRYSLRIRPLFLSAM